MERRKLMTTEEVAKMLRRSKATLMRWRRERTGPPWMSVMGRPLYDPDQIDEWLKGQTVDGADE